MSKPGRPSKLSEREKSEILRRLALGEKPADLRKEFRLSETTFRRNFSAEVSKVREIGTALAHAELALAELPISAQVSARSLADQLKDLGQSLVTTATLNGRTAEIMAGRAHKAASDLPANPTLDDLRLPGAYVEVANKATSLGSSLLASQKEQLVPKKTLEDLICEGMEDRKEKSLAEDIRKARLRVANGMSPFQTIEVVTGVPRDNE